MAPWNDDLVRHAADHPGSIDDFESEGPHQPTADGPSVTDPRNATVSLAEVKKSGLVLDSYEALAIVEALCSSIITSGDRVGPADLNETGVFLHAGGSVTAASDGRRDAALAVHAVGRILSDLLPENDFMFLRERVVSRALAAPPYYASLEDFLRALEYYARPNRAEMIQGVYLRWCELFVNPPRTEEKPIAAVPASAPVAPKGAVTSRRERDPRIALVAGLGLVVVVLGGAIWYVIGRASSQADAIAPPETTAAPAASPSVAPPTNHDSTAAPASPGSKTSGTDKARPPSRAAITRPRSNSGPLTSSPPSARSANDSVPSAAASPSAPRPAPEGTAPPQIPALPLATSAPPSSLSSPVYDATNTNVIPPRVRYPQSLDLLPVGSQLRGYAIQIVIDENGLVEDARALQQPTTIAEYASIVQGLSITKTWRFQPAKLDGKSVRFRLLVPISK